MRKNTRAAMVLVCAYASAQAQAQAPAPRPIGPITAVSSAPLKSVASAVQVSDGRVYVNDITAHRLLLFDSTLAADTVILDSLSEGAGEYGNAPGSLLRFRADSVLFIAPLSLSMLVLNPAAGVVRVAAIPLVESPLVLLGSIYGTPAFDAHFRLVYFRPVAITGNSRSAAPFESPDSALVVRFDLSSRLLDTAVSIRIPKARSVYRRDAEDRVTSLDFTAFPPQMVDGWAVAEDGAIAVVRGQDYHVDWLNQDSTRTAGPRLPFDWERMTDAGKDSLIDSAATALETIFDTLDAKNHRAGMETGAITIYRPGTEEQLLAAVDRPISIMTSAQAPRRSAGPQQRNHANRARMDDVPDYRPPFRQGSVYADRAGRIWIRTNKLAGGQPVYDVVGRAGLVDRVLLPPYRTIAGFGPDIVYLAVRDSAGVVHLERARLR